MSLTRVRIVRTPGAARQMARVTTLVTGVTGKRTQRGVEEGGAN